VVGGRSLPTRVLRFGKKIDFKASFAYSCTEWSYGLDYFTRTELKSYHRFHESLSRIIQLLLKGASKLAFGEISKIYPLSWASRPPGLATTFWLLPPRYCNYQHVFSRSNFASCVQPSLKSFSTLITKIAVRPCHIIKRYWEHPNRLGRLCDLIDS
jgi:hypothetical protein